MAKKRSTSKGEGSVGEVRRWRKRAFSEIAGMSAAQRSAEDARIAKMLGLRIAAPADRDSLPPKRRKAI